MNILVVDDDPLDRKLLHDLLEIEGHRVFEAGDCREALAVLESHPIDSVVTDLLMARMDGDKLCLEVRKSERWRETPLIVCTNAFTSAEGARLAENIGADRVPAKPVQAGTIPKAIREAAGSARIPAGAAVQGQEGESISGCTERLASKLHEQHTELTRRKSELTWAEDRLRESEERFRLMVDSVRDYAIFMLDTNGIVVSWNLGAEHIVGYREEEIVGRHFSLLHPPERRSNSRPEQALEAAVSKSQFEDEGWRVRKDGSRFWAHLVIAPVRDAQGQLRGFAKIMRDVTEQREADERLKASHEQLRALAIRLQSAREEEGTRIAREVHDDLGQALTGMNMDIHWLETRLTLLKDTGLRAQFEQRLQSMGKALQSTVATVQRISYELRPSILDDLGLLAALEFHAGEFSKRSGIECAWRCKPALVQLPREEATAVFRIFQEILANVARHAQARNAVIGLDASSGTLSLDVADDGKGFDPGKVSLSTSLGLAGMRERALAAGGWIEIISQPGAGTRVCLRVPIDA